MLLKKTHLNKNDKREIVPHIMFLPNMLLKCDILVVKSLPLQPTDEARVLDYLLLVLFLRSRIVCISGILRDKTMGY